MKIVTLIENHVVKSGLCAEHGLSIYVETKDRKILFDTGQTSAFLSNAQTLGIDITAIDSVVISHGHADHTGGLKKFLEVNSKAQIYCKREALEKKFHGPKKYIGTMHEVDIPSHRLRFIADTTELAEGLYIVAEIPLMNKVDTAFHNFQVLKDGKFTDDTFEDELFMTIVKNNKLSVVSSCSHRGITNMVQKARVLFPKSRVNMILGGFHLKDENMGQYPEIVDFFNSLRPESVGTCHCTGVEMYSRLKNDCISPVFYNFTGHQINL